ncbi:helix-turn-helix domain-containing protein [Gordonia sp. HNM0687]|uniref:Helix-turn-helix domain-containing protein n=1 Tax=Gordonia mangrovi TaxID=2665643 RepID=A0A6L7GVK1_9ACTN|nr:helix-turn-helix domain-containing protein [Gordonia mangrovi]MXP24094.1 helix-turn-helix domain-containing protein [Gordonia mangrovi]UVF78103.1 helix-turn-helix domain-containing protein [Gordonia mangrovi]
MSQETGRDRIRELLDAVLNDDHHRLDDMAAGAHASAFHFSRQFTRHVGEAPVALRRRVMLERAAWQLQRGSSVTDAAFAAGYDSVEGFARAFSRAFGHAPSRLGSRDVRGHWLPSPNGIHFHSPTVLYVDNGNPLEESAGDVLALMVRHDLDDTSALLDIAKAVDDTDYHARRLPGHRPLAWSGSEESIAEVLTGLVAGKAPWLASIAGDDTPEFGDAMDVATLTDLHGEIAPRWLALTRDIDRRAAWSDRIVDAICEPPESFLLSQIWAHVLTFSAHRRQLIRWMLADAGVDISDADPDPIMWHRQRSGGTP